MSLGKITGTDVGLVVARLALGGIMIAHGVQKLLSPTGVQGFTDFLAKLEVPYANYLAIAAISAEIGGGLLVALGLFARLGAFSIAGVLLVAIFKVHLKNGFWIPLKVESPGEVPWGMEYTLALLALALCILFAGGGTLSLFAAKPKGGKPPA
jgi:putative oxidoreductase